MKNLINNFKYWKLSFKFLFQNQNKQLPIQQNKYSIWKMWTETVHDFRPELSFSNSSSVGGHGGRSLDRGRSGGVSPDTKALIADLFISWWNQSDILYRTPQPETSNCLRVVDNERVAAAQAPSSMLIMYVCNIVLCLFVLYI